MAASKQMKLTDVFKKLSSASANNVSLKRAASSSASPVEEKQSTALVCVPEEKENIMSTSPPISMEPLNKKQKMSTVRSSSSDFALLDLLLDTEWKKLLLNEFSKGYMKEICNFLQKNKNNGAKIFPPQELIFNAFNLTPFNEIRVVLLGQDPYHNDNQAHGLCFSVLEGEKQPPSLKNMFKELVNDVSDFKIPSHGCLDSWASQGVFMLNATLTVEAHKANSHSKIGWQKFTDAVIKTISDKTENGVVFLLWGGFAHKKEALINQEKHRIIKTAHPSPLSFHKFKGCRCFSQTNEALAAIGRKPINWALL